MELTFKTFEKQRIALRKLRDKTTNEVLYGGGARGGKSWLGTGWVHMEALEKPESAWLIAREELTKLRDTTLLTFFKTAKELGIRDYFHFNAQSFTATFNNGSIVFFREVKYIPSDPEFDRLGSYDLTGGFIDEAQQIHPKAISVLRGRFSVLEGPGWKTIPKTLYTCNPAKNWIYADYVKPDKNGTLPSHRAFIKSLATDNPFVSQDYIDNLMKSDKVTRERLLYGNFEYDADPATLMGHDAITDLFTNTFIPSGEKYMSVDVARKGADQTVIIIWSGWRVEKIAVFNGQLTNITVLKIKELQNSYNVPSSHIVIDEDGVGGGVVDNIPGCKGFVNNSRPMPNPDEQDWQKKNDPENYDNLKSQCYFRLAKRVNNRQIFVNCDMEVQNLLSEELGVIKQKDIDKDGKIRVIPKDEQKELLGRSPDFADALMMREYFTLFKQVEHFAI